MYYNPEHALGCSKYSVWSIWSMHFLELKHFEPESNLAHCLAVEVCISKCYFLGSFLDSPTDLTLRSPIHRLPVFISTFIPNISIAPLQIHYCSLLRGAPDYKIDTVSELTRWSTTGNCEWRTCGWSGIRTSVCKAPILPLSHHARTIQLHFLRISLVYGYHHHRFFMAVGQ